MADIRTVPTSGRVTLRLAAHTSPRPTPAAHKYARAFMLRLARRLAKRASTKRRSLRQQQAPAPVQPLALNLPGKPDASASQPTEPTQGERWEMAA